MKREREEGRKKKMEEGREKREEEGRGLLVQISSGGLHN